MREIEIKARVGSTAKFIARLEAEGIPVSEPAQQRDEVFGLIGVAGESDNSEPWLRIRTETKAGVTKYIYTLKKSVTNQLDSIEHETEVENADELRQIILHSGFTPYSDVTKTRRKAKINDVEICIDIVDGLGEFVEAEKLTSEDADYEQVAGELRELLKSLGISEGSEVTDGYDVMMKQLQSGTA